MKIDWLNKLKEVVRKKGLVVFQFGSDEWLQLLDSKHGANEFTIARSHQSIGKIKTPTACILLERNIFRSGIYFGVVSSRASVSTLESRVKIRRAHHIKPSSKLELSTLVTKKPHSTNLHTKLSSDEVASVLSSKLSVHLIEKLAEIKTNCGPMRSVTASISSPKRYRNNEAVQQDAVQTALRAFSLPADDKAVSLELVKGRETALARVNIVEDAVVEHDARYVPGYDLVSSDVTGRAVFEKGFEKLEVYTANRRPLENVFGVDLIYLNKTHRNIVMLQYKMLEQLNSNKSSPDWIYRPDAGLDLEINRMREFSIEHRPGQYEYRLNPQVFYLKFVKRNGAMKNSAIVIPIDHFELMRTSPECKGPRGGVRVSYNSLNGRYLRQGPFLGLVRSGYVGAYSKTTIHLSNLVQSVLQNDKAVVAAIQSQKKSIDDDVGDYDPLNADFDK